MIKEFSNKLLRQVAGKFPTGITVVCTRNESGEPVGITANSFISLSLEPPLIGFCVMKDSNFMSELREDKAVSISILSEEQKEISDHFAGIQTLSEIRFDNEKHGDIIQGSIAWYQTVINQIIEIGDHFFIVCKIEDLGRANGQPILYYDGYRSIGKSINGSSK